MITIGVSHLRPLVLSCHRLHLHQHRLAYAWTSSRRTGFRLFGQTSNNEDGFAIERCAQRGCNNFIEIGRVFPNIWHFVDSQLFPNTQYYYRIRGFNAGGTSAYTEVVSAKTLRK